MGGQAPGALNASGFSAAIKQKKLPHYTHITYNGIFNENFFSVGERAKNFLEIHHGLGISNCDLYGIPKRNYFLSLFLKSNTDGQKRTRPINIVVCLDISGSMNSLIKQVEKARDFDQKKTRLNLARQAIIMLYQKLNNEDAFCLVVFNVKATTIMESRFKRDLTLQKVKQVVQSAFQSGGTIIKQGFRQSVKCIKEFRSRVSLSQNYQHRIVLLTDVEDNSVYNQKILIDEISNQDNINTTIIGISTDFKSNVCEKLIDVKGFNYFCAVENNDLKTYLVDRFDYNFFPCVKDVQITLECELLQSIEVFGSVDSENDYPKVGNTITVTKMKTGFPSDLQKTQQGQIQTQGGLILVKLNLKIEEQLPQIKPAIYLSYRDLNDKQFKQEYKVNIKFLAQQYYSDSAIQKGVKLFYYTHTMRKLLQDMAEGEEDKLLSDENKFIYKEKMEKLKQYCPKEKLNQLNAVIKIIEERVNVQKKQVQAKLDQMP